ncbi:Der1-like family-domain-containing protein [Mycena albidolilacea]|uniref:Derlin n=1 Tax=Mycena albidolilacea TaxID=1033008 RepID=A0AAD6Z3R0_9AGAR|nr:Der1-like family-domain-containing protein [Mycena albidolilacea]
MSDLVAEIRKIPPVTRTLCISSVCVSLGVMMSLVSPYKVIYTYSLAFGKLEIWRLYSSFFLGSGGINYIFDLVMLYRTMNDLESGPYARKSADLAWQLAIASAAIIVTSIPVGSMIFFRPLLLCIAYIGSALAPPGAMTSIMGLITLPVKYLPYIMLGMDLLMGGPSAVATALPGAVVGHLWWWGVWGPQLGGAGGVLTPWSAAPRWLRQWMGEGDAPPPGARRADGSTGANSGSGVHVIAPRRMAQASAPAAGAGSSATETTGYNWGGGGNRLGRS